MFPYNPIHQTFINIYEDSALKMQAILDASHQDMLYYAGSTQGRWAVVKTFVLSGIEHIMIGPDHILFLIGLLLLGGTLSRLALIVTSFTIGHSITLSLAALDVVSPSARFIEPLIALTIVVVGADNLLVLRNRRNRSAPSEAWSSETFAAWLAIAFGLIHGFGFAYVSRSSACHKRRMPPAQRRLRQAELLEHVSKPEAVNQTEGDGEPRPQISFGSQGRRRRRVTFRSRGRASCRRRRRRS